MMITPEQAKKVITKDLNGQDNGFLIELTKLGKLTTSYLSCAYPGAFKGYHLHNVRAANYVCIKGELTIILYTKNGREEFNLVVGSKLQIPKGIPTGLYNKGTEEAWIVNNPEPAYDPDLKGEQIDYTQEQLDGLFGPNKILDSSISIPLVSIKENSDSCSLIVSSDSVLDLISVKNES